MGKYFKPVYPVQVSYRCDNCSTGFLQFLSKTEGAPTVAYIHQCDRCHQLRTLDRQYPYLEYREVPFA